MLCNTECLWNTRKAFPFMEILVSSSTFSAICDKCSKDLLCLLYLFLVIKGDSSFFPLPRRGLFPCWHVCITPIESKMVVSIKLPKKLLLWGNFHECEIMGIKTDGKVPPNLSKLPGFLQEKNLELSWLSPLPFSEMHFYYLWRKWSSSAQCKQNISFVFLQMLLVNAHL